MSPHLQGFILGAVFGVSAILGGGFIGKVTSQLKADLLSEIRFACTQAVAMK